MFVEYAAEPQPDTGRFQKHAAFRVGTHIIRANTVNDASWMAKKGTEGVASAGQYLAGLEFGPLDFGIVAGRPQDYEINTNPSMSLNLAHPNAMGCETLALARSRLASAFAAITNPVSWLPLSIPKYFKRRYIIGHRPRRS